ncbi:Endoribonuclease YbeY [Rubripirellula lacrimiformis]|uniref:Endoribonuclease YbeY n=1 Tax=Rubripirellula lacrimiformis TaxID=1930273 RepID=A0A517NGG3_9BACT|nr:rRNA maturation RNase YbeY [Rubripirellula lacrimiformis]QDT06226.1 Endoribonuclease YbeY [Rubripirellula lacrimiformis]
MSNTLDNNRPNDRHENDSQRSVDRPSAIDADAEPPSSQPPSAADVSTIQVEVAIDSQLTSDVDVAAITRAVQAAAAHRGYSQGELGVRVTDDPTIHQINAKHLNHHYATDVISFGYSDTRPVIEGEMVVSIDTAQSRADEIGWSAEHELLLYVVHGTLHIAGMDDHDEADRSEMRAAEKIVMTQLGIAEIHRFSVEAQS